MLKTLVMMNLGAKNNIKVFLCFIENSIDKVDNFDYTSLDTMEKTIRITIETEPEIRNKFKSKAAGEGKTIKEKLIELIKKYLNI